MENKLGDKGEYVSKGDKQKIEEIYVITGKCEERHKGHEKLIEQMEQMNQKDHEAIERDLKDTIGAVHDLATVSNGKLAKVHDRVNEIILTIDENKFDLTKLVTDKIGELTSLFNTREHKFNKWVITILVSAVGALLVACATIVWQTIKSDTAEEALKAINTNIATLSKISVESGSRISNENNELLLDLQTKIKKLQKSEDENNLKKKVK